MNVSERIANDAFSPYHGTEEMIQSFPKKNGAVYFAYDTKKIFFDVNGNRYQMSDNGIIFVYGDTPVEELLLDPDTGLYLFPRANILHDHYLDGSIIINSDNTFYKIIYMDDLIAYCEKLLMAGSGGGDGDDDDTPIDTSIVLTVAFPFYHPYGTKLVGSAKVVDTRGGYSGTLTVKVYNSSEEYKAGFAPRVQKNIPFICGNIFDIELEADELVAGDQNFIICQAEVNLRYSGYVTNSVNCVDLYFAPTAQWNPISLFDTTKGDIIFPYQVYAGEGSSVPKDLSVTVVYTLTEGSTGLTYEYIPDPVTSTLGEHNLTDLINRVKQGGHSLTVYATVVVGDTTVVIGDYYYGIGVYKHITSGSEAAPIIWSPYNETEVENYTIIKIPYNVFDPTRSDNQAYVEFFINGEEQIALTVQYQEAAWHEWTIASYIPEQMNSFIIQCGLSWKEFQVYIKKNLAVNLDSTVGSALYLNALGRSNLETSLKRATWPNKGTVEYTNFNLGDVTFNNFNWSNNGWIDDANEGACLRVSNGASVEIPLTAMISAAAANRTYEFDFKVRNAVDYSRLIIEKAVNVDKDGNVTTDPDKFAYDEDGTPITKQEKTVSSGEGAFLTYFNPNNFRGFMLGTQEAFFSLSQTSVVNARYTDDQRVKISIVVDADGALASVYNEAGAKTGAIKMIYLYVNGVLTNIMSFTDNDAFDNAVNKITINSTYCDVDIFNIRVYPEALSYSQITQNWIGDAPTLEARHDRYDRNNAIVDNNKIDYTLTRKAEIIPTMVITTYSDTSVGSMADDKLPYQKGNKKVVGIRYWDPADPSKGFHCQNVELDVQGTSSQGYPRRNYKLKTKEKISTDDVPSWKIPFKFEYWDGDENQKNYWYQDHDDDSKKLKKLDIGNGIEERTFCLKADYMESSSTHNTQFANLIQTVANGSSDINLKHPLNKDHNVTGSFRTTIYGFPILVFWENSKGNIEFVGKYNFNLDKGATDAFGFSNESYNTYTPKIERDTVFEVEVENEETGEMETVEEVRKVVRHATFAEITECWEFCQNQSGLGKFQSDSVDGFYETIPVTEENAGKLQIYNHFEPRYTYSDWDIGDLYDEEEVGVANEFVKNNTTQFKIMWDWVHSTDTTQATGAEFTTPLYYLTLSKEREAKINYYALDSEGYYNAVSLTPVLNASYQTLDDSDNANNVVVTSADTFAEFLSHVNDALTEEETANGMHVYEKYVGPYTFVKHDDGLFYYETPSKDWEAITECGLTISESYARDEFTMEVAVTWQGFSASLYERFDTDSVRYRKAKFRNEFEQHFDLNYTAIYFIMTELLLCYDSRQKNMMIATFGPNAKSNENGDYIWYPIFYDIDTQLGVNNSGHVSWDYNTDATKITENADGSFSDSSIFSGAGSVLWINFAGLMMDKVYIIYRSLRNAGAITLDVLVNHYNLQGSDVWSEIMKNIDSDYKYISPATTGYIDQEGGFAQTQGYFYCLQGDRALSRKTFFRNRLNYIDSQWLGGAYNPGVTGKQIKLRYNANDLVRTSDDAVDNTGVLINELQASASFDLRSYLSQYLSVVYDETATTPKPYPDPTNPTAPVTINPPDSIAKRLADGIPLSQQLAYIRGPEYISDLGDLSNKYINEIDYSQASRLRTFTLGSLHEDYRNDGITEAMTATLSIPATAPKGLLSYMNLSNLSKLAGTLDLEGCEKLKTFMGTGTALSSVTFTNGNMLTSLYLPETVNSLVLKQPLELEGLISTAPALDYTPTGMYVKNLTDKLDTTPDVSTSCRINTFVVEKGKLGIDTYRILNYLYQVKEAKYNGTITDENTTAELSCDLTEVGWNPYTQVEADTEFDIESKYYELKYQSTYEVYHDPVSGESKYSASSWKAKTDDGVIYTFDENFDTSVIKNLDIVDAFLDMYLDETKVVQTDNLLYKYRYKSTNVDKTDDNAKILPTLTGRLHVNNLEGGDALSEYEVWSYYNKYYPELEITADHMNEAYSVQFIEYTPEGVKETLEWLKYKNGTTNSPVVYSGDVPTRLHYDFLGWAVDTSDVSDGFDFRGCGSVITDTDEVTLYATEELATAFPSLDNITNGRLTLVAVYKVHGYKMSFYNWDGSLFDTIETPAGKPIITPTAIPQRDSISLDLYECYRFIGWHTSLDNTGEVTDLSYILAGQDTNFYAVFEVTSVYNDVIDQKYLDIEWKTDAENGTYAVVGLNSEYGIGGKVCFPITVYNETDGMEYPIREIAAGTSATGEISNGLCGNTDLYAVFFLGCQEGANQFSQVAKFNDYCFDKATNLVHVDFPDSLTRLGQYCFRQCTNLIVDTLNCVQYTGQYAFRSACVNNEAVELMIPLYANDANIFGNDAFRDAGWRTIYLGNDEHPFGADALKWITGNYFGTSQGASYVRLNNFIITYNMNEVSQDQIEAQLETWIRGYADHLNLNPNLVTYLGI